jgi:hypothetical protein
MCARGEPKNQDTGALIAERWNRLAPVDPIAVGAALRLGNFLAIEAKPGAALALYELLIEERKRGQNGGERHDSILQGSSNLRPAASRLRFCLGGERHAQDNSMFPETAMWDPQKREFRLDGWNVQV